MGLKFPRLARWASRRVSLWLLLLALVVALLGLLVWLAERYESGLVQSRLEHNAAEAVTDIRSGLNRNIQSFQALHAREHSPDSWPLPARQLLHENRELVRLEWRDAEAAIGESAAQPRHQQRFADIGAGSHEHEGEGHGTSLSGRRWACKGDRRYR